MGTAAQLTLDGSFSIADRSEACKHREGSVGTGLRPGSSIRFLSSPRRSASSRNKKDQPHECVIQSSALAQPCNSHMSYAGTAAVTRRARD